MGLNGIGWFLLVLIGLLYFVDSLLFASFVV